MLPYSLSYKARQKQVIMQTGGHKGSTFKLLRNWKREGKYVNWPKLMTWTSKLNDLMHTKEMH